MLFACPSTLTSWIATKAIVRNLVAKMVAAQKDVECVKVSAA